MCLLLLLLLNQKFILNTNTTLSQDMDDIFEKLKSQGQDTVDGVVQWMREANLIGPDKSESKGDVRFDGSEDGTDKVGFESFKATLEKISKDYGFNMDVIAQELNDKASTMEAAFEKLKKEGKNDVDHLVKWMKDSNIIGAAKEAEEKAKKLFEGANQQNIDLETFKTAVAKVAEEQKQNVDELMKSLAEKGPKLMEAVQAGASAFKDALTKK